MLHAGGVRLKPHEDSSQTSHRDACLSLPALLSRGQIGRLVLPMLCCSGAPRRSSLHPLPTLAPTLAREHEDAGDKCTPQGVASACDSTPDTRPCHVRDAHHLRLCSDSDLRRPTRYPQSGIGTRQLDLLVPCTPASSPILAHHGVSGRNSSIAPPPRNTSPAARSLIAKALALSRLELRVATS